MKLSCKTKVEIESKPKTEIEDGCQTVDCYCPECKPASLILQEQLHFLQTLIDTIPSPIFYKDISNLYLGCNKAFEKRLGLNKEEIVGRSAYDLFPENLAGKYHKMDLELLENPGEQFYEDSLLYADDELHHVIIKKGTFTNMDGSLGGLVGVTVDISDRKRAEDALQKAHDELEVRVQERTAELAKANEELRLEIGERLRVEEALKASSEKQKFFAYSVMHDLKSPTIGISGLTKLLQRQYHELLDERGRQYCSQILKASEHLASLVEKINAYIAAKELPLKIEKVDPEEIFHLLKDEFSRVMALRHISLHHSKLPPEIRVDRLCFIRVLRNLVDNALKYGGEDLSEIKIEYEESEQYHQFSVSDNGIGIKNEHIERIFGLFERSETSKGTQGSGLGLAIVREIAERHEGKVWVNSGDDHGTTFYISFAKKLETAQK